MEMSEECIEEYRINVTSSLIQWWLGIIPSKNQDYHSNNKVLMKLSWKIIRLDSVPNKARKDHPGKVVFSKPSRTRIG